MPEGEGWSLIVAQNSAARNGFTNVPFIADSATYVREGSNTLAKFSRDVHISGIMAKTAAIANWLKGRFKHANMKDYDEFIHCLDQTAESHNKRITLLQKFVPANTQLTVEADNTNNAQVEGIALFAGTKPVEFLDAETISKEYGNSNLCWVRGTATGTLVASTWTDVGDITWSKTFDTTKNYAVLGMCSTSATGMYARIDYSNSGWKPGCACDDTLVTVRPFFAKMGSFPGTAVPRISAVANAGDTAFNVNLLIAEI